MKTFFHILADLFVKNWGIKLLALILSCAVYFLMKGSPSNSTTTPLLKGVLNDTSAATK